MLSGKAGWTWWLKRAENLQDLFDVWVTNTIIHLLRLNASARLAYGGIVEEASAWLAG